MDYIDVRVLLAKSEPLTVKEAVDILNSWRLEPESYQQLLQTKGASVFLKMYQGYSEEIEMHIFTKTDKQILHPDFALKFFELKNDDLALAFLDTLNWLTFTETTDDDDGYYAWPYLEGGGVYHLSAETIENILLDWHFVFDWNFDKFGSVYSVLYNKLLKAEKCCECLAVNSFNLFNWLERDDVNVEILAKHYCFANYSLDMEDNGADADFRKNLVHYFTAVWNNMEGIVGYIQRERIKRFN